MVLVHYFALSWVRNPEKRSYHSVHHEHEPWFYLIEPVGRRWRIGRIRFRNKKRAKWEEVPGSVQDYRTLHEAQMVATTDYWDECHPAMEAAWLSTK